MIGTCERCGKSSYPVRMFVLGDVLTAQLCLPCLREWQRRCRGVVGNTRLYGGPFRDCVEAKQRVDVAIAALRGAHPGATYAELASRHKAAIVDLMSAEDRLCDGAVAFLNSPPAYETREDESREEPTT